MALEVVKINMDSKSLKQMVESNDMSNDLVIVTTDNKAFKVKRSSLLVYNAVPINVLNKIAK